MRKVLARLGLGGLIVLLAFAIGCGGDDEPSSGSETSTETAETAPQDTTTEAEEPAPVTKADFIKEADATCKDSETKLANLLADSDKAQATATDPETLAAPDALAKASDEVGGVTDALADFKQTVTQDLENLEIPTEDQKLFADYVKAREAATADLNDLADTWRAYGKSPSQATVDKITAAQQANVKSADVEFKIAEDYGFKVCSLGVKAK